jgi:hypothetical protein
MASPAGPTQARSVTPFKLANIHQMQYPPSHSAQHAEDAASEIVGRLAFAECRTQIVFDDSFETRCIEGCEEAKRVFSRLVGFRVDTSAASSVIAGSSFDGRAEGRVSTDPWTSRVGRRLPWEGCRAEHSTVHPPRACRPGLHGSRSGDFMALWAAFSRGTRGLFRIPAGLRYVCLVRM